MWKACRSATSATGRDRSSDTRRTPPRPDDCWGGRRRLVSRRGCSARSTGTPATVRGGRSSCGCARFRSSRRPASASWLGLAAEWPERLLLAFAISYSWVGALSVLLPLTHLTIVHAGVITLILCAG